MKGIGGHQSAAAKSETWLTPPHILEALGGADSFALDPCAAINQPWPTACQQLTELENGLSVRWFGRVWLNPPYSTKAIAPFMARMADHNQGTALVFARTETETFCRYIWDRATALLFIEGRLHFHRIDGTRAKANSGAPSVLCAYGRDDAERLAECGINGAFVPLLLPRSIAALCVNETWKGALVEVMRDRGPMPLADLYRLIARRVRLDGRPNWQAKVRQVLQRGPFERVSKGVWALEEIAA